jgi:hypothetical protein
LIFLHTSILLTAMQFFTAVLSALALAASTASANPIEARQNALYGHAIAPQILYPTTNVTWHSGSSQTVRWNTSQIPASDHGMTGVLFLGNDEQGFNPDSKLLPNQLCFTVVVTQQYLSFVCTYNAL